MEQFANNAQSTLASGINNSVAFLTVQSATGFSTQGTFRIQIDNEIMLVTGVSGNVFTVSRGQEGTVAAAHNAGACVTQELTAGALAALKNDVLSSIVPADLGMSDGQLVQDLNGALVGIPMFLTFGGRLTLTSNTPVTTSDVTGAGTIYYTPYLHDRVTIYDGTRWKVYTFTQRSLALTLTSGKNYDVFLYDNSGTLTLELSAAWTNDTTRADGLTTVDGVSVKSSNNTRLWLGTIRASGTNTTEDSLARRFCWNAFNRLPRKMVVKESSVNWSYGTNAYRQANASSANSLQFVLGALVEPVAAKVVVTFDDGNNAQYAPGIGIDNTTANNADLTTCGLNLAGAGTGIRYGAFAFWDGWPSAVGYHYTAWLETAPSGVAVTVYGTGGVTFIQSGISGVVLA
ncbi:hypothetical protein AYO40_00570 [Planctomycetaceae bacterium SCGC AG-212-D15]|nr:hypothetical protein AYO40_00570 [Planctomycetaceae bacterium SCGC AG-212-D15]